MKRKPPGTLRAWAKAQPRDAFEPCPHCDGGTAHYPGTAIAKHAKGCPAGPPEVQP